MLIEALVIQHLNSKLGTIKSYGEVPDKPPKSFVVVERANEGAVNRVKNYTVTVMAYSDTMEHAAQLHEQVIEAMDDFSDHEEVSSCKMNNGGIYTNTAMKKYRFRSVFNIVVF